MEAPPPLAMQVPSASTPSRFYIQEARSPAVAAASSADSAAAFAAAAASAATPALGPLTRPPPAPPPPLPVQPATIVPLSPVGMDFGGVEGRQPARGIYPAWPSRSPAVAGGDQGVGRSFLPLSSFSRGHAPSPVSQASGAGGGDGDGGPCRRVTFLYALAAGGGSSGGEGDGWRRRPRGSPWRAAAAYLGRDTSRAAAPAFPIPSPHLRPSWPLRALRRWRRAAATNHTFPGRRH